MKQHIKNILFILGLFLFLDGNAQSLLTTGEYFIDNDPGLGNGVSYSFTPSADITENIVVSVDTLSGGIHNLYFRIQDQNRNWSLSSVMPFYKVTPSVTDITAVEYFWDIDPGFGNGFSIPISSDTNISITSALNISSLSDGLHILYVRIRNASGFWSLTSTRPFFKITDPNTPIQRIEYFWDTDPGFGNGTSVSFTPGMDISVVFNPSFSSLADGFHNLYVRVQNQNGFWSITNSQPFYKLTDPSSDIAGIEYFWDNDPGFGNGTSVTFTQDTNISVVFPADISQISDGFHNLFIRVRNTLGWWSLTSNRPVFKVSNANSDIIAAEYFIDTDPGFGQATAITMNPTATDVTQNALIDLTNVSGGLHTLYVRVQNSDGLWSLTHSRPFLRVSGRADLEGFEYFFDNEPGHGNGSQINFTNPVSDTTWTGVIDLTSIPQGYHRLYVRAKDANGFYSLTNSKRFAWCDGPQINFSASADTFCLGDSVSFIDSTVNLNVSTTYQWDFDSDGVVDDTTIGSVSHLYLDTGTYFATLIATNYDTCYDSFAVRIVVLPPPIANFVADTACNTFLTSFVDSSSTALPTLYSWDFDNDFQADSSSVGDEQHIFPGAGIYPVNLLLDMGYGCRDTFTADVLVKEQPFALFSSPGNCLGQTTFITDLSTNVLPQGDYSWDVLGTGDTYDTTEGSISLIYPDSGLYQVSLIIKNNNGCIDTLTRGIKVHGLPLLDAQATSPVCFGGFDGSATVNVIGDPTQYIYRWTDELNQSTQTAVGLYARRYFVSVTDSNGCYNRDTVDVLNPPKIDLSVVENPATCGLTNGSATVTVNTGVSPFDIYWTNGTTGFTADNLAAGIYIATVTDGEGCENIIPALISNTNAPSISISNVTDVTCNGDTDGAIDVDVTGGVAPYTYKWSNGLRTEDISNLAPGPYELIITGADSCIAIEQGVVNEPPALLVDVEGFESYCGLPAGSALASVIGGSGAPSFLWSTGATTPTVSSLNAGVYTLDVTDTNGCTEKGYVAISDTGSADIFIDSIRNVTCGLIDGGVYIKLLRVRGVPDFLWNNGDTTEDLENVDIGLHYVQVNDSNDCKAFEFAVLEHIAPIPNPICITTVDSATNHNFIAWERLNNPAVESYNVYKESTAAGVYFLIGNVKRNDLGEFEDTLSNVGARWWKYKITALDSCGNESDINAVAASAHKTMQLNATMNAALDSIFLIWDPYIGFSYPKYFIYRFTDLDGYNLIDSVDVPGTTYVDVTFPQADTIMYWVFANNSFTCDPNKNQDYSRTRSNPTLMNPEFLGLSWLEDDKRLRVYPNPSQGKVYVSYPEKIREIVVEDVQGTVLKRIKNYDEESGIDLRNFSSGVYFLDIRLKDRISHRRIIID